MKYLLVIAALAICATNFVNTTKTENLKSDIVGGSEELQNDSKILFSRKAPGDVGWSIYSINPDGSDEDVLIPFKSGQGEYNPSISPTKKSILFNTYRYGGWKLALYDLDQKSTKKNSLTRSYYTNGVFSPDGNMMAYERNLQRTTHIFVSNIDGSSEKMLTTSMGKENRIPSWSADGKFIYFYSEQAKNNDIYRVEIASSQVKNITNNKSGNDFGPSVSPDGKLIAFFSDRNGFLDVYVMDRTGKNQTLLTSTLQNANNSYNYYKDYNQYWMFKVAWSPDGEYLVFSNVGEGKDNIDLFTVKKDGSGLKQITNSERSELTPTWGYVALE